MEKSQQKNLQATKSNSDDSTEKVCPKCKGRGYIVYRVPAKQIGIYGNSEFMNDYVEKCSACNGYKPIDEDLTGVPDEFRDCDISKFNWDLYGSNISFAKDVVESFISRFKEWALKGEGLYFYSKTAGSGKTFLACCIGKSVMMKYNIRFKFITITDYIEKVSEGYSMQKQGIGGSSPAEIYKECELLVLDDMGTSLISRGRRRKSSSLLTQDCRAANPQFIRQIWSLRS